MRRILTLLLALAIMPVYGLDVPRKSRSDERIQHISYNPDDVVAITAAIGVATHIVLQADERVLDMASGFSAGWEVTAPRNNIYLKPKSVAGNADGGGIVIPDPEKWNTNLEVVTNKRSYSFYLRLLKPDDAQLPAYRVVFDYPLDDADMARQEAEKRQREEALSQQPMPKNWNYTMQIGEKSADIAPAMAYDDGRFTYLQFPGNREFPAVFHVAEDKGESLVNTHVDPQRPDVLVVHRVTHELVLRLSNMVVSVYNDSFDSHGEPPRGGTTQLGVNRVLVAPTGGFEQTIEELPAVTGAPIEYQATGELK